jgi:predicted metal-dependent phosphoesterase TrpH
MRIDLHTHSTVSDGTDTPAELVAAAAEAGLDVLAITDHDTTAGWEQAAAALAPGQGLVRGAELSCLSPDGRGGHCSVHLLAYLFDPTAGAMVRAHDRQRADRRRRLRSIAERMAADGLPVDPDAVLAGLSPESMPGRPHLATALVSAGVVSTVDEAFVRFLNDRGRYYVPSSRTPVHEAIAMVRQAGGVTVLAHVFAHHRGPTITADVIRDLAASGLDGLEVDHPDHLPPARAELRALAAELDLLTTGSSDYHGDNKTIHLGQETTAPETLDAIVERATGAELLTGVHPGSSAAD